MKKFIYGLTLSALFLLTGCLDTVDEITINKDGSGQFSTTNDMSAMMSMLKMMAADQMDEMKKVAGDTSMSFAQLADSIQDVTEAERALIRKGNLDIKMDMQQDIFKTKVSFPFANFGELQSVKSFSGRILSQVMKKQTEEQAALMGGEGLPNTNAPEDYFDLSFSKGQITRKVNKSKYANVNDDNYLKEMREAASMGMEMNTSLVINLPKKAKKVQGENVVLSNDKKQLTIKTNLEDLFEHPEKYEFKVTY